MENKYLDVLQNIEFSIVSVYHQHNDLNDYEVMAALDALIDCYRTEVRGHRPKEYDLSSKVLLVFQHVQGICEYRLGRGISSEENDNFLEKKTAEEILPCLRKIRKSVERWNDRGGKQGYLLFVKDYII